MRYESLAPGSYEIEGFGRFANRRVEVKAGETARIEALLPRDPE